MLGGLFGRVQLVRERRIMPPSKLFVVFAEVNDVPASVGDGDLRAILLHQLLRVKQPDCVLGQFFPRVIAGCNFLGRVGFTTKRTKNEERRCNNARRDSDRFSSAEA